VTQVVSPTEGVVFHNRLTHTLEVAQIGRRVAERLTGDEEGRRKAERLGGIDPDVVETAALVHDLGHPPYGHAVEKELNRLITEEYGLSDGYEGNAQSFRIVTKLAMRHPRFAGLNLTRASLNASLKYPWLREIGHAKKGKKWGAYETEREDFDWVREEHPGLEDRPSVEAQIMDWADDVAYAVHDVDDFQRAGLIPLDRFRAGDPETGRFAEYAAGRLEREVDEVKEVIGRILEGNPTQNPYPDPDVQRGHFKTFTAALIASYVTNLDIADDPKARDLLLIPGDLRLEVDVLKQLTWRYVIDDRSLKTQQHGQRRVVEDLFGMYWQAATSENGLSKEERLGILPEAYQKGINDAESEDEILRSIADVISSMAERQLLVTHKKLTGTELGSITDLL
jgi:dGTPase